MLERIIKFSITHRWLMLLLTLGLLLLGAWSFTRLPIDATPDITNQQVQVNTEAPAFSPLEVEQRVTFPIETALAGLPHLEYTRSMSRYGLSQVTVVFEDGTDLFFARQQVSERLQQVRSGLPEGLEPQLGPIATGMGEVFMYTVEAEPDARKPDRSIYTPTDLRVLQDWVIRPQLRGASGVTEVNTIGGFERQVHVTPDPLALASYGFTLHDIVAAIAANDQNIGAGYIERNGLQLLVRVPGQFESLDDIRNLVLDRRGDASIRVGDVATVADGHAPRAGAATQNGREVVIGTVIMLAGANSREVSQAAGARLREANASLPDKVKAEPVYDRTALVDRTIKTVATNLAEGALLVIIVLFLLLRNIRAALITAAVIPLAMLFTVMGMVRGGVSGNLMSLGALDFGLIVDGAVIIIENCLRRFGEQERTMGRAMAKEERFELTAVATAEVIRPSLFGLGIIGAVYLPIFALTGIEGKLFHPMAITVVLALTGAMLLSLTFVPAAVAVFLGGRTGDHESRGIVWLKRRYRPALEWSLMRPWSVAGLAIGLVALSILVATRLGTEFVPHLDEGDIVVQPIRIPGTSLTQAVGMQAVLEKTLVGFPEVDRVFSKLGTAEVASDPMPPSVGDTFIMLKPRDQWPDPRKRKSELIEEIEAAIAKVPGNNYEITQPIQMRTNELISGVRADVAVKLYGDDLDQLVETAEAVERVMASVEGAADVKAEQVTGLPLLSVEPDREALRRFGLNPGEIQDVVATAVGGESAGHFFEGDRRFDVVVQLPENLRQQPHTLESLPVSVGRADAMVPLRELATVRIAAGPNQINRENGKRRVVVTANVRNRDLGGFVGEVQDRIKAEVDLPEGYWIEYGGAFEHLISASQRLAIVVPVTLLIIFGLLFTALGSGKDAAIVFTGVPLALTGGVLSLWLRDIPISISAGVGFIALSGVAVLNGLVLIAFIRRLREQGGPLDASIVDGAIGRLRPVVMTATVASLGFLPMALNVGPGSEVQRPLATVVIGGILSSTLLTLIVLPTLYKWAHRSA